MDRLLIVKDVPFGQNKMFLDLVAGELGVWGMNPNTGLPTPCGNVAGTEYTDVRFGVGGDPMPSPNMVDLTRLKMMRIPYKASTKPVWLFTISHQGTSALDEFTINISPIFGESVQFFKRSFSTTGKKATIKDVYDALANEVNCEKEHYFQASVTEAGLLVTPTRDDVTMVATIDFRRDETSLCETCYTLTANEVSHYRKGSGSAADVRRMDEDYRPNKGVMNNYGNGGEYMQGDLPYPRIYGDKGEDMTATFNLLQVQWKNQDNDTGYQQQHVFDVNHTVTLAFPSNAVNGAEVAFVGVMEAITGMKFKESFVD
jgi:hypothetical protein